MTNKEREITDDNENSGEFEGLQELDLDEVCIDMELGGDQVTQNAAELSEERRKELKVICDDFVRAQEEPSEVKRHKLGREEIERLNKMGWSRRAKVLIAKKPKK